MRMIYLEDINLSKLHKIKGTSHQESTLFHDKTTAYKIFNDLEKQARERKQIKVELLGDGVSLPNTLMPKEELFYGHIDEFEGYTMDYKKRTKTLYQKFLEGRDITFFLDIIYNVSKSYQTIHTDPRNIVMSDVHAGNIIIDKEFIPYIIDIDSCKIDGVRNESIPLSLKYYLQNRNLYTSIKEVETTPNTDRLCFFMMVLGIIFRKHIDNIHQCEYDEKTEEIIMLKEIRNLFVEIKKSSTIPEVPYFHEVIKERSYFRKLSK